MKRLQQLVAAGLCFTCTAAWAQEPIVIAPVKPSGSVLRRPYTAAEVPPVRLGNSQRITTFLRGGNLYLTARDAIALAIDNNIDIEIARYNPIALEWRLERAEAGGALPGVPSNASQASSSAAGQGVLGSQQSAGVAGGTQTASRGTGNATVSQVGPVTQNYDPSFSEATTFSHRTLPQANAVQTVTQVLIQNQRAYSGSFQQGLHSGGGVTVSYNNHYLNENAPSDILNPSVAPNASISIQHNLLQGFGTALGTRNIVVARMNLANADVAFRGSLTRVVTSVLNSYYALVGDYEDRTAKQGALDTARAFLADTKRRLDLGAVAVIDVTTAENQVAQAQQALVNSSAALEQQEVQLKSLISRNGLADPVIASARIVPLDHIEIPPADDLPPMKDLVKLAVANRTDLINEQNNLKTAEISNLGTANGLLPQVQVFATRTNNGLAGDARIVRGQTANPYFVGGIGDALGQVFRQNFPTVNVGVFARVPINNRQAQADYGIDQLSLRQQQLTAAKDQNQAQVDVLNALIALRQARARYEAAVQSRTLQERLFDAEQKKLAAGESTTYNVTQQQRDLANARSAELGSLVSYQNARTNLSSTTGTILNDYK